MAFCRFANCACILSLHNLHPCRSLLVNFTLVTVAGTLLILTILGHCVVRKWVLKDLANLVILGCDSKVLPATPLLLQVTKNVLLSLRAAHFDSDLVRLRFSLRGNRTNIDVFVRLSDRRLYWSTRRCVHLSFKNFIDTSRLDLIDPVVNLWLRLLLSFLSLQELLVTIHLRTIFLYQ